MKPITKKTSGLIIPITLIMSILLSACGTADNKTTTQETTAGGTQQETTQEATSALSTVEQKDYEGYVFKIVSTNQDNRHVDIVAESENGVILNDLVFRRNSAIEEKYNITIQAEDMDFGSINSMIKKNVAAGDNSYDLYFSNATAYSLASEGNLLALNDMPGLDIKKPWWDQNAIADMSIGGNIYMLTGDITPTGLLTSECILFNKKLFKDNNIEFPYETAFAGKWTLDEMTRICTDLTKDVNGDGKFKDKDDIFSFTCWFDNAHAMFYGAGGKFIAKDSQDIPSLDWNIGTYSSIYTKIYNLVIGTNANYSTSDHEYSFKVFNEGRAFFCGITFQKIEAFLRDMEDDFGVLPMPKFDESQARYQTDVSGAGSMIVIPITTADPEMVGTITQALAAGAYDSITPSLYDVIVSVKNLRDEESAEMVQMIIRNRVFDMAHMYAIPGDDFVYDLLKKKSTDVTSYFEEKTSKAQTALDKLVESFLNNNK
ncbi:MAG: extracellular solute-binding protein [Eubacteriales bacterium]